MESFFVVFLRANFIINEEIKSIPHFIGHRSFRAGRNHPTCLSFQPAHRQRTRRLPTNRFPRLPAQRHRGRAHPALAECQPDAASRARGYCSRCGFLRLCGAGRFIQPLSLPTASSHIQRRGDSLRKKRGSLSFGECLSCTKLQ